MITQMTVMRMTLVSVTILISNFDSLGQELEPDGIDSLRASH
jgi:hypothetical protein